jgi:hypothetical protein
MDYDDDEKFPIPESIEELEEMLVYYLNDLNHQCLAEGYALYDTEDILESQYFLDTHPDIALLLSEIRKKGVSENRIHQLVETGLDVLDDGFLAGSEYTEDEWEEDFEEEEENKEYDIGQIGVSFIPILTEKKCMCTICRQMARNYKTYRDPENMTLVYPCGHCFHRDCITNWLKTRRNPTCPNCRRIITQMNVIYRPSQSARKSKPFTKKFKRMSL